MGANRGISVIMAAFNAESTIGRAIDSILRQRTSFPIELIVVDDGSTDVTAQIVSAVVDARVRLIRLDRNIGRAAARNVAAAAARFDVIAVADADDVALPGRLEHHRKCFDENQQIVVAGGQVRDLDSAGLVRAPEYRFPASVSAVDQAFSRRSMGIAHPASAFRADWFERVGGYDESLRWCEDFDLFLRGWTAGSFLSDDRALVLYSRPARLTAWRYWWQNERHHRAIVTRIERTPGSEREQIDLAGSSTTSRKLGAMIRFARYRILLAAGAPFRWLQLRNRRSTDAGSRPARVIVRTLPFSAGNYGGVLQAYALQRVMMDLGAEVATDTTSPTPMHLRLARSAYRMFRTQIPMRMDWNWRSSGLVNANIAAFVRQEIASVRDFEKATTRRRLRALDENISMVIVGSDQVWRRAYAPIPESFLSFLGSTSLRRISYAASFGRGDLAEYSPAERAAAGESLRKFSGVSVREDSGVLICAKQWGVSAERHVDPTLLLKPEDYRRITASARERGAGHFQEKTPKNLIVYCLDGAGAVTDIESAIVAQTSFQPASLLPPRAATFTEYAGAPHLHSKMPVSEWLASIENAGFVLTDSFHGTVFSILFNRPFAVYGNEARGTSRLMSLLKMFELESHLVSGSEVDVDALLAPDWGRVNGVLERERKRGLTYLAQHLASVDR